MEPAPSRLRRSSRNLLIIYHRFSLFIPRKNRSIVVSGKQLTHPSLGLGLGVGLTKPYGVVGEYSLPETGIDLEELCTL